MLGFGGEIREGEAGEHQCRRTCYGQTLRGPTGTWVHAEGGNGGGGTVTETAEDEGTQRGVQRQEPEACGWWLWARM